jgi:hypothetical protein
VETFAPGAGVLVTDSIVLNMPSGERFRGIATLVLGGVGTRMDLPYERMDDLQLAVLSVLDATDGNDVTFEIDAGEKELRVAIGPVRTGAGRDEGLLRIVSRLVDDVGTDHRESGEWIVDVSYRSSGWQEMQRGSGPQLALFLQTEISSTRRPVVSALAFRATSA